MRLALERVRAPAVLRGCLDRAEHAARRHGRRITRSVRQSGHVLRLHVHEVHVGRAGANIFGRDVATAERIHEPAVCAEEHLALGRAAIPDDHRLAATEVEPCDGVLVRHAAREAQRVDDRLFVIRILPEARAAEGGTERRVMDRDDAAIPARFVVAHDDLLVAHFGHGVEQGERAGGGTVYRSKGRHVQTG